MMNKVIKIVSIDELLSRYNFNENNEELFNSDVIILHDTYYSKILISTIESEYPYVKVKHSFQNENVYYFNHIHIESIYGMEPILPALELGSIIITTLAGLVTICEFVMKQFKKENNMSTLFYIKTENDNKFLSIKYEGRISQFYEELHRLLTKDKIETEFDAFDIISQYKQIYEEGIITKDEFKNYKNEIIEIWRHRNQIVTIKEFKRFYEEGALTKEEFENCVKQILNH